MTPLPAIGDMLMVASANLREQIKEHEGFRPKPYRCPAGYLTIGYGLNLDAGISRELAELILDYKITEARHDLAKIFSTVDFRAMGPVRIEALTEMMYNLGLPRFQTFQKMIRRLKEKDWHRASAEMIDSSWAMQVGVRATVLAAMIRTGAWT